VFVRIKEGCMNPSWGNEVIVFYRSISLNSLSGLQGILKDDWWKRGAFGFSLELKKWLWISSIYGLKHLSILNLWFDQIGGTD